MIHIARSIAVLTAVLLFSASAVHAAPDIVPGMWEITTQVNMPGMPMAMPKNTMKRCLDSKDVVPTTSTEQEGCTVKDMKVSGNTVTWTIHCETQGMVSTSKGSVTYRGTSFSGTATITMTGEMGAQNMTQTMEGKRIGKCTQ